MSHSVTLNWTPPSNSPVTSFNVQRATDGVNFTTIATPNAPTFVDTDPLLVDGATFQYQVEAVGPGGTSVPSSQVTVQIPTTFPVPDAPTNLTATAV